MRSLAVAAALLVATPASAEDVAVSAEAPAKVTKLRRTGAVLAALGPGFFLRGTGSYLVGKKRTARKLAEVGGAGAIGMVPGATVIYFTGGYSPTLLLLPPLLVGSGMFLTSWWADIAVAAGLENPLGQARATPPWSVELATLYLRDPFRTTGLVRLGARLESGRVGLGAGGMIDAENQIRDADAEVRVRILGAPPTGKPIVDGSRLIARAGVRAHTDDDDGVTLTTGELEVIGRYDLFRLDRHLRGTFMQLSTGIGVERVRFSTATDYNSIFLATIAWGLYLGNRGEAAVFYDQRRDHMAGGLPAYRAAGFLGSVGTYVDYLLDHRIAARAQIEWGNALITTFGIRVQGAKP